MTQENKDTAMLHFLVVIWGFTAILGVLIQLPPVEIVFYRTLTAAVGLYILLILWGKPLLLSSTRDYLIVFGVGIIIAAHWILFFLAARISNISICLAGLATCSLWTSFIEPLFLRKKVKIFEVALSFIAFIGIAIIFNVEFDYVLGFGVAVLSAFFSAVFSVINAKLTKRIDPYVITFYEMIGAFVSIALFFPIYLIWLPDHQLQLIPSWSDWGYLLILSLVCTVFAYSYSVELMQRMSAFFVNLTTNLEPVYGIILALIFFPKTEQMTPGFYLGTSLILLSVLLYPVFNKAWNRKALDTNILR